MLALGVVDCGFYPQWVQTKDYEGEKCVSSLLSSMILDIRSYWPEIKKKKENFKHSCNEKSINFTGPIRYLLVRGNRTSAKFTNCR